MSVVFLTNKSKQVLFNEKENNRLHKPFNQLEYLFF